MDATESDLKIGDKRLKIPCCVFQASPLQAACEAGGSRVVELLIKRGADVMKLNLFSDTCMDIAIEKKQT
jgi:hypothetical protein